MIKKWQQLALYTIEPNNPVILLWNIIITFVIIHTTFALPLEDAFGAEFISWELNLYRKLIFFEIFIMVSK